MSRFRNRSAHPESEFSRQESQGQGDSARRVSGSAKRTLNAQGRPNILQVGMRQSPWQDLYYLMLTIPWVWFFVLTVLMYVGTNGCFAIVYLIGGNNLTNAQPGSFWDAFFFSVQTMATIGYGAIAPSNFYANVVVSVEAMLGLLGVAVVTGLTFARLARPTARVLFSRVAVIAPYNGVPTLMFRTANRRGNQILEARLWLSLVRDEVTEEGYTMRRFYDLKLSREHTPVFSLTWTAMHPIDADSPLYGMTSDELSRDNTEIVVSLMGIDETVAQTIHARYSYIIREVLWNHRFRDIFVDTLDSKRAIDFTRFHDTFEIEF
ncbi:ion channel [Myxacorys almedinensis]|uniref:ATP-sensitive inward rectifier potassium channel 10 n=1 Tax=Myxacorys almedinensis A TaxID=2690445 RepID=A0A8J7YZW0_9CYAN|nr:ion channel [Myxacorys almedinensis]NDJ17587.1 ATP-sensitive inward rectifier potassium channel 10 [Myxacorys almedinensis A]